MIYLDNGATSFPKPGEVVDAVTDAMTNYCANPGRSGHFMAARTAQEIFKARLAIGRLFNIADGSRIIFTKNCTEALNMAIKGVLKEGEHVITSSMEHNSVMRPLMEMDKNNVDVTVIKCSSEGKIDTSAVKSAIKANTRMIIITAASNVTGTKMPLEEIGRIALRNGILFMVDGAQGAGHMDLDVRKNHIDILAASGHKGLMGPQGTGFLYIREGIALEPLMSGGTGSKSKELLQPKDFPEGYEAGTVNSQGIIGLGAAVRFINKIGMQAIEERERKLTERLQAGLKAIDKVILYGVDNTYDKTAVVAMNIQGYNCEEAALLLNDMYGIAVRAGFHCSGMAHKTIGTEAVGCIRMCPGFYTSESEIDETVKAVGELAEKVKR